MAKKLMIIDTDCGVDDALAITMALSHNDWEVLAITCVAGNIHIDGVCENVLRVLNICEKESIEVYKGCEKALVANDFKANFHKADGFGGVATEFPIGELQINESPHASNAILDLVKKYPEQITIVALGPLTNLALCHRLDPNFTKYIQQLVIMGGNIDARGNILKCSEFNFTFDPEAAHMMVTETLCPVIIVPWETCFRHAIPWDWFDEWVQVDTVKGHFLQRITSEVSQRLRNIVCRPAFCICDLFAMAITINPDIIKKQIKRFVEVELHGYHTRGMMLVERRPMKLNECSTNVEIIKEVDMTELKEMYKDMLL